MSSTVPLLCFTLPLVFSLRASSVFLHSLCLFFFSCSLDSLYSLSVRVSVPCFVPVFFFLFRFVLLLLLPLVFRLCFYCDLLLECSVSGAVAAEDGALELRCERAVGAGAAAG